MSHFRFENLSHIHLTSSALRAFDEWHGDCETTEHRLTMTLRFDQEVTPHDLSIRARDLRRGIDLSDLRKFKMPARRKSPAPSDARTAKSTVYDQSFEQRLLDNQISAD